MIQIKEKLIEGANNLSLSEKVKRFAFQKIQNKENAFHTVLIAMRMF